VGPGDYESSNDEAVDKLENAAENQEAEEDCLLGFEWFDECALSERRATDRLGSTPNATVANGSYRGGQRYAILVARSGSVQRMDGPKGQ